MKERIKKVFDESGDTQEEIAKKIGISKSGVQKLVANKNNNNPSEQTIRAICEEFHISRRWLETGEGEMYEESEGITKEELRRIMTGNFTEAQIDIVMSFLSLPTEVLEMWLDHVKNGQ